jgi:valyl-tRNA synthetase
MALSTKYDPSQVEDKWYSKWMEKGFFHAEPDPDKESFCIVIPPPNVTGVLHMGHMLNHTIQDILTRKARMEGKKACWVPGTDHASIATEAKVVGMLRERKIKKSDLTRERFLEYAWEWKEKYGGIILQQLKKLGASCDWERTAFTMDPEYYRAVIRVFVDLYKKGYIYRGLRMINWDCEARTALSNEEVIYQEEGEKATLYTVRYRLKDKEDEWVTIATVRPETILGDTAVAVNPDDGRYRHLIGHRVLVPFINREIPVIADTYVDMAFGTGCLKVTPAHDPNDYEIGLRHGLEVIDTLNDDGTLNEKCGMPSYVGKDRFEVRKQIVKDLEVEGHLINTEEFVTRIGRSERTDTVVEPKLSLQWFIRMKEISRRASQAVENDEVRFYPVKFKNIYRHWMENVRDWCISRQLWWGHRIPAYYFGGGDEDFVVAETPEDALEQARKMTGNPDLKIADLSQDPDVLDTWASSWLWPMEVFNGFDDMYFDRGKGRINKKKNPDLNYFYPTQVLVTAPEIIFFWVARMIIAGYEYLGEKPFSDVYFTGIVRDKKRRKMSKSLGNSPDPLDLIREYGADGVRTGMLFSSPAGNDLLFDVRLCEQGRNFANKIWNAFRLIKGWTVDERPSPEDNDIAMGWFESKLNYSLAQVDDHFSKYRISDALMSIYKLIWDDFCSWYLELIKPPFGDPIDRRTLEKTYDFLDKLMRMLHPFMPFITEEIYRNMKDRAGDDFVIQASWPEKGDYNLVLIEEAEETFNIISNIRNFRNSQGISHKKAVVLFIKTNNINRFKDFIPSLKKMANLNELSFVEDAVHGAHHFIIKNDEFYIPAEGDIDQDQKIIEIERELEYTKGFLQAVMKKLDNKNFVENAPEKVVEMERKKQTDAQIRIRKLEESLDNLTRNRQ